MGKEVMAYICGEINPKTKQECQEIVKTINGLCWKHQDKCKHIINNVKVEYEFYFLDSYGNTYNEIVDETILTVWHHQFCFCGAKLDKVEILEINLRQLHNYLIADDVRAEMLLEEISKHNNSYDDE